MAVISNKGKKKAGVTTIVEKESGSEMGLNVELLKGGSLKASIRKAIRQYYVSAKSSSEPIGTHGDEVQGRQWVKVNPSGFRGVSAVGYLGGKKKLSIGRPVETEQEYIHLIRKGISKGALDHLMLAANISPSEMAEIMEVKPKVFAALKPNTLLEKSQSEKAV
ncbi:MAG: hypothetical protein JNM88_01395, partial [Chitinophagaceae bacterium]|nr:hypothetical protein [Chitinophagaceae bacterium]